MSTSVNSCTHSYIPAPLSDQYVQKIKDARDSTLSAAFLALGQPLHPLLFVLQYATLRGRSMSQNETSSVTHCCLLAQICFPDSFVVQELFCIAFFGDGAGFENVSSVCDRQRLAGVLLNQKHCYAVFVDILNDVEDLVYEDW